MVHHHPRTPDFNVVSVKRCFVVRGLIWFVHSSQPPSPTGQHWTMGGRGVKSARVWIIRPPTVLGFDVLGETNDTFVSFVSPNTSETQYCLNCLDLYTSPCQKYWFNISPSPCSQTSLPIAYAACCWRVCVSLVRYTCVFCVCAYVFTPAVKEH